MPIEVPTLEFTFKANHPTTIRIVKVAVHQPCQNARELCDYLLLSPRARGILLNAVIQDPALEKRKIYMTHALFPIPLILYHRKSDDLFRSRLRKYFRSLPPGE